MTRMKQFWPEGWLMDTAQNLAAQRSINALADACEKQKILEARATMCDSAHNLIVDLGCMKGIIPREEGALGIAEGQVRDIALISRVNKPVCFIVTRLREDENRQPVAILSRRLAQQCCQEEFISRLRPGQVIDARVTHLEPFGAFCDIGCGIASLIPIDAISVSRIFHPSDRFCTGDDIRAVVKSVDETGRVNLTHKELLGTWEENASLFAQGETVSGIIRTVEDYGAFVELTPNLAGLAEPREGVIAGQQASVYIKSILPDKMKIKLIIIDAFTADYTPDAPKYFWDGSYMREWRYSPECCEKFVGTVFD